METPDSRGGASLSHRGLISWIYVGDRLTLQHIKYISRGPHGFRKKDFKAFPIMTMERLVTRGGTSFDPRGLIGRIFVGDH